jgi:deoxyribodipyrimidine photo-lyase
MSSDRQSQRQALLERLQGCFLGDPKPGTLTGGRTEALRQLHAFNPVSYGRTRNHLDGAVSRLSPYLRHGMISINEVHEHLRSRFAQDPIRLEEFFRQLAWRDFFEKVLTWYGRRLDDDLEQRKHSVTRSKQIPLEVLNGNTGLPCVDGMLHELFVDGYLHNHARLWFAAYLCHFRGVRWQEGARLFRQYLYDGDHASNGASWQWVEGTFASKPYFMNKENIAMFSGGRWCHDCSAKCPFDADYPTLQHRLFTGSTAPLATEIETDELQVPQADPQPLTRATAEDSGPLTPASDLVWVHDAAMSWDEAALKTNPTAAMAFVFDEPTLRAEPWAYHRLKFVLDGLDDLHAHLSNSTKLTLVGKPAERLGEIAGRMGATTIHVSEHPNPRVLETLDKLRKSFRVLVHPRPVFADYPHEPKRFSRYWEKVASPVLGYLPNSSKRMHQ